VRIAISTGGGDAPGLNAVIRAAVLSAINRGWEVLGVKRGYAGLLGEDDVIILTRDSVRGIRSRIRSNRPTDRSSRRIDHRS
jgi:6-phosphofructokinase